MLYTKSLTHPKMFSIINGNTELDSLLVSINRSIALILLTAKGELFGNPDFGSDLRKYVFDSMTPSLEEMLKTEILQSILNWESRIKLELEDIALEQVSDHLKIHISYTLTNSNIEAETDILTPIKAPQEV